MKTVVITSGYFNPIHPGHIECLEICKSLGEELRVIVNSDHQARLKTGKDELFQDENYRTKVVSALRVVDQCFLSVDKDGSVCESIKNIFGKVKGVQTKVIFGKGGDRFSGEIPELKVCQELGIEVRDGLGEKTHSSSDYRKNNKSI